jgi:hypothetical protein
VAQGNLPSLVLAGLMLSALPGADSLADPTIGGGDNAESPFTQLFDTTVSGTTPMTAPALAARKGWVAVAEDTIAHVFTGDVVCMNDRLIVVIRQRASGVEVYSKSPGGCRLRAMLLPLGVDGAAGVISSSRIIENSQAAVMLEAVIVADGGATATFQFRLTAGEPLLEVRGGEGAGRLRVCDEAQYIVVPDFFADDMVFDPAAHDSARIGLPTENSVLGLTDEGNAIVACVWRSSRQNVDLMLAGEGAAAAGDAAAGRRVAGYEIELPAGDRLWMAVMEGPGIWHARRVSGQHKASAAELSLEWKPPMPARWRTDFATADGTSLSTYFADPQAGPEPENARSNGSCRFDAGRALVRMTDPIAAVSPRLIVAYPVERTRATPLTALCLVDIMRNALGVGPCQYVLDAEGLGNSESPTPDQVTHWVEKQLEKKASKRDVGAIREQLTRMTEQVKRTDERIGQYVEFAGKMNQACADYAKGPGHAATARRLAGILEHVTLAAPTPAAPIVEKLTRDVATLADHDDALAKCQQPLSAIRSAGAAQDDALAKLRMAARRLKQESRMLAASDPQAAAFAGQIRQQADQMLTKK